MPLTTRCRWSGCSRSCSILPREEVSGTSVRVGWSNNSVGTHWCDGVSRTTSAPSALPWRRGSDSRCTVAGGQDRNQTTLSRDESRGRQPCRFLEGEGEDAELHPRRSQLAACKSRHIRDPRSCSPNRSAKLR